MIRRFKLSIGVPYISRFASVSEINKGVIEGSKEERQRTIRFLTFTLNVFLQFSKDVLVFTFQSVSKLKPSNCE